MIYRIAKISDVNQLARVHLKCCSEQAEGFMFKLGVNFLESYYKIFLNEKYSVIIVAENSKNDIVGFHSGSLKTEEHIASLRRHRVRLFASSLFEIIRHPSLFGDLYLRYKSTSEEEGFVVSSGPRGEYWAWLSSEKDSFSALELHKIWHLFLKMLGVKAVRSEVNSGNKRVLKAVFLMGATIVKEFKTPDGHTRYILEYNLENYK